MPHSTSSSANERRSLSVSRAPAVKMPVNGPSATVVADHVTLRADDSVGRIAASLSNSPHPASPKANGILPSDRWQPRRDSAASGPVTRHGRQKSLSDAINTIRSRRASVSANAHELADALRAPVSPKLVFLCVIWYLNSALTNTSSKSILNAFPKPVTLTLIQFAFVSLWCILLAELARRHPSLRRAVPALQHGLRPPSRDVIETTLPLAAFQIGGHLLSSTATSSIPVSLVHTIKGLSPLFTVLAYRFVFRVHYGAATYLSLIPLTLGVMLACSAEFSGHVFGVLCAFGGAIVFVTQNIFSKRLFNEAARAEADGQHQRSRKLDKLNLLCYSSGLAFILTGPLWLWSEGFGLMGDFFNDGALDLSGKKGALGAGRLTLEFLFNGTFHFGQNIMAFVLLSMVSPVTYSVASLIKRIFVIVVSIVWFGNSTTRIQAVGIALTFLGLYLYDRTSDAARVDRRIKKDQTRAAQPLLPIIDTHLPPASHVGQSLNHHHHGPVFTDSPLSSSSATHKPPAAYGMVNGDDKRADAAGPGRPRGLSSSTAWLPPGTRQEETWRPHDMAAAGPGKGVSVS